MGKILLFTLLTFATSSFAFGPGPGQGFGPGPGQGFGPSPIAMQPFTLNAPAGWTCDQTCGQYQTRCQFALLIDSSFANTGASVVRGFALCSAVAPGPGYANSCLCSR